jgi:Ser/Thr protein kinase RdoA (MazF antagonist)
MTRELDVAGAFKLDGRVREIRPYGHGLINDSFVAVTASGRRAILQRINRHVFPRPELIMENLRVLADHVRQRHAAMTPSASGIRLPEIFSARDGKDFVVDADGGFWRAMEFIENTRTFETITGTAQAGETGLALGRFHALIHDLAPARLHQTLPGFHDAPGYFARFLRASARPRHAATGKEIRYCLSFVEARWGALRILETAKRRGVLAIRPIHGDTKLDNFLFDVDSGRAVSLVDLDTVQPGLIHYDLGDCLRSCANPAGESPGDIATVRFDLDIGRAILKGYLTEAQVFLAPTDYAYLYDAIRLIPLELGLRFLTDYLEGDHYFKTDWPGQNLHRALVQFRLTGEIEKNAPAIKSLINESAT